MKNVLILGAGHVTKPIVEYLTGICGYSVTMAARTPAKAQKIIAGNRLARATAWHSNEIDKLDRLVAAHDLVINMIPKAHHVTVAQKCLKHRRDMVTTSYEIPPIKSLDDEARDRGVLFLNELGEDPGMDHFATQMLLDHIAAKNGTVRSIYSYGCGLPSFRYNNNPFGYKFSWEPKGVFLAAQVPAVYLVNGQPVAVTGDKLFENFHIVDIDGLGTFESYPNKDVTRYVNPLGLPRDVTFYRGLLRFSGYCNNMRRFWQLDLLDDSRTYNWRGKTFREFAAFLLNTAPGPGLEIETADFLGVDSLSDIMVRLKWLGFFNNSPIAIEQGSKLDVFVELLLKKLSYVPGETDMTIIHVDIEASYKKNEKERRQRHQVTMVADGESHGNSAMAKAVGLPPAIAARLIFENKIPDKGVHMPPTLPYLRKPMLIELARYGFIFRENHRILTMRPEKEAA